MSYADKIFIENAKRIFDEGRFVEVRPVWEDTGENAKVLKIFDVHNVYDLSKGEFPALTLRPIAIKSCIDEILWIYQKKSNDIHELKSHVWDEWATSDGKIGLAYGYQIGNRYRTVYNQIKNDDGSYTNEPLQLDQTDYILHEIQHNPYSRRIITNMYTIDDLYRMGLDPCAFMTQWNVRNEDDGQYLDMILYQRSQDFLVANNWNVCQYAALLLMVAKVTDKKPGKFIHQIADCHIYDRHLSIVEELIEREQYDSPRYMVNPNINDFYKFLPEDVKLIDYKANPQIKNIPVAV